MLDLDYTIKVRLPITIFAVLITYGTVFWLSTPSRKGIGYEPEQPIAFSHKLHAGDMQIDCRYCHVGVDKSRHATIPSVDTCMNCHNTVKAIGRNPEVFAYLDSKKYKVEMEVKTEEDKRIKSEKEEALHSLKEIDLHRLIPRKSSLGKVVLSIAKAQEKHKDKSSLFAGIKQAKDMEKVAEILDKVIENEESRLEFFKIYGNENWQDKEIIELKKKAAPSEKESQKLCRLMMDSLFEIDGYKSLEIKKLTAHAESGKPLEWKRIYRLPEYVYFNHSVHIAKGIDCTNCHGNVADLDSMKKMKPITMGRCIDCHRGDFEEFHKDLKEKVTGPENCGACHR